MTESKQEAILRKVRALIAKANGTEFEAERQAFLNAADRLMETYAISEAMLLIKDDPNAKLVVRRDMDFTWWLDVRDLDRSTYSEIYWLWMACVTHCRCITPGISSYDSHTEDGERKLKIAVFGTESDLNYLDLLFTDLWLQMVAKLKPRFDPKLEIGANVRIAKEAGMTWDQILDWSGLRDDPLGKRLLPAYRRYCDAHGLPQVKINPKTYQWSFTSAFCTTIRSRLRKMKQDREGTTSGGSGKELALRTIDEQAREEMYNEFPSLRPHPKDCGCDRCEAARKSKNKPVKYNERSYSYLAAAQGHKAGEDARIATNDPKLKGRDRLSS